jgi:hypothetical protein
VAAAWLSLGVGGSVGNCGHALNVLGAVNAIRHVFDRLGPEFLVTYCDSRLDIAYRPLTEALYPAGCRCLICVVRNEDRRNKRMSSSEMALSVVFKKVLPIG